jgi:hypothetical protein
MGRGSGKASTAYVSYRCADDPSEVARDWTAAEIDQLAGATLWVTFRWHLLLRASGFGLRASVDGPFCRESRKHIPDYLLITDTGPVVVDMKTARRLADPKVAFTFGWTRELVEARPTG